MCPSQPHRGRRREKDLRTLRACYENNASVPDHAPRSDAITLCAVRRPSPNTLNSMISNTINICPPMGPQRLNARPILSTFATSRYVDMPDRPVYPFVDCSTDARLPTNGHTTGSRQHGSLPPSPPTQLGSKMRGLANLVVQHVDTSGALHEGVGNSHGQRQGPRTRNKHTAT
jgi:hypothetical protein